MAPLILLLSVFVFLLLLKIFFLKERLSIQLAGRISMAALLVFTGVAHFPMAEGMSKMLPEWIGKRELVIYLTGIIEIAAAIGLLIPRYQKLTAWLLILFFICVLPANIYAAINHIDPTTGLKDGPGPEYLWFRIPLQILFIGWVYLASIMKAKKEKQLP